MPKVVTRFAPSPTGFLHIGGARTALFNWLYAKAKGGEMLLRIEDTDRARSTDGAIAAILEGLAWLGIDWTGQTVYQFDRQDRHREVAEALVAAGKAYRCYATREELDDMREKAKAEGRSTSYDGRWRDCDPRDAPADRPGVIRLKTARDGDLSFDDKVQGNISIPAKDIDDFILLRSDGTPTYMLAVVVDDHDMGVTHIIRGDDHLTNAAKQIAIYQALGWETPVMCHIPLIHGPDGAKLSKRHGALGVESYRDMGYLPQAMVTYLARLGWSHGDDELMSVAQMIDWFDFDGLGKSASRLDFAKLDHVNSHYMKATTDADLMAHLAALTPALNRDDLPSFPLDAVTDARLRAALPSLKERAKTLVELVESAAFLYASTPLTLDDKAAKTLDSEARRRLSALSAELTAIPDQQWTADVLQETIKHFADANEIKLGKVAQPLRAVLTGKGVSPSVFDVMTILGKTESLARIRSQSISKI